MGAPLAEDANMQKTSLAYLSIGLPAPKQAKIMALVQKDGVSILHTYIHVHIHAHAYTHVYIHIHTYTYMGC